MSSQIPHSDLPTHFTGFLDNFKKEYSVMADETAAKGQMYLQYIRGYHTERTMIKV